MSTIALEGIAMGERQRREADTPQGALLQFARMGAIFTFGMLVGFLFSYPSSEEFRKSLWALGGGAVSAAVLFFGLGAPLFTMTKQANDAKNAALQDEIESLKSTIASQQQALEKQGETIHALEIAIRQVAGVHE